jgi:hypothetical protein
MKIPVLVCPFAPQLEDILMHNMDSQEKNRSHYGSKVPAVTITVFKYRNKIGKIVVKAVPYSVT